MDTKPLGRTGTRISALAFGTMTFGGEADEAESARLYAACRAAGVDTFDCANVYTGGRAEEILGRLVAHERDAVVLTSKVGMGTGAGPRVIRQSVEASLKRMGTDRFDVFFIHIWDPHTRLEDTLRTLDDLVAAGKVIHLGVSNFAAWQIATALGVSAREGWARFAVIQPMYNLLKRQAEVEILPLAQAEGLGVVPYNPLAGGVLTGKYLDQGPARGRLDENAMYARRYAPDWMAEATRAFIALAAREGVHPVTLAVAFAAAHPGVTAPLLGARTTDQLAPALAAATFRLDAALHAEIAALTPTPPPATDRLEEQG